MRAWTTTPSRNNGEPATRTSSPSNRPPRKSFASSVSPTGSSAASRRYGDNSSTSRGPSARWVPAPLRGRTRSSPPRTSCCSGRSAVTLATGTSRSVRSSCSRITVDGVDLASPVVGVLARPACGRVPGLLPLRVRRAHVDRVGDLARVDDDAVVLAAVGRAGATDVLERMPRGLDTQLGPTWHAGVELSIGQWQKIAFARGFMRDRPLLCVLDEPTASLDAETEHALYEHFARHHARRAKTEESRFSSHTVSRRCAWPTRSSCSTGRAWSSTATTTR